MKNILYISLVFILLSCSKYEIEEVSGNQPPSEKLITQEMKEAYINRLYITLTGRKPSSTDFASATDYLNVDDGVDGRAQVIEDVMSSQDYTIRLYDIARADYLESVDTSLIRSDYEQALYILQTATGPTKEYFEEVAAELKSLLEIPDGLISGAVDVTEVHRRLVNNMYYDDINMGTENFVVATFQNFLFRYPTNVELENASAMVDGVPGSVFLQAGNSKLDFIDIFFNTDDYAEGVVITLYRKYLFRDPSTAEMYNDTQAYLSDMDYGTLQQKLLSSDEYFFN